MSEPARFAEVMPGVLRGGEPSGEDLLVLARLWNVKRIVSLDMDVGFKIHNKVVGLGMEHVVIPILHNKSLVREEVEQLKEMIPSLFSIRPMYVHCVHGRDRTGLAVALFRVMNGWTPEAALTEAEEFGFGEGLLPSEKRIYVEAIESYQPQEQQSDIVDLERLDHDWGPRIDPLQGSQTFSPAPPIDEMVLNLYDSQYVDDGNDAMAQVGVYENNNPTMRGVGPIEPVGIMPSSYSMMW